MVANEKFNNFYSTYSWYWYKIEITSLEKKKGNSSEQARSEANPTAIKIVLVNCVKIL